MLEGWQFGSTYKDKTPLDFIADTKTGIRPGAAQFGGKKPNGVATIDISNGIEQYMVIPPVAIWNMGKWYDELSKEAKQGLRVEKSDERQAYVVPGDGTPGNYMLRMYIVPKKIAEHAICDHPKYWTKFQREKGDNDKPALYGASYTGWGGYQSTHVVKKPEPPKPPPLPQGMLIRCPGCGHFFDGETQLSGHANYCCPGSDNWGTIDGADWVVRCKCCNTLAETALCLTGYPRKPKDEKKEVAVEQAVPSG